MTDTPADLPGKTTLEISRQQRAAIAEIQAALARIHGRPVTTKETVGALISAWKDQNKS